MIISQEMGIMYTQVEQREGGVCFKNNISLELIIYCIQECNESNFMVVF